MGRRVLRRHIWSYSVCLMSHKKDARLIWVNLFQMLRSFRQNYMILLSSCIKIFRAEGIAFTFQYLSRVVRKPVFAYAKTKTQISFAVTSKLICAFVFATRIVQSLYFLNPEFQASSHLLWLHSPVCVGPGRKPRRPVFLERGSFYKDHWMVNQFRATVYKSL